MAGRPAQQEERARRRGSRRVRGAPRDGAAGDGPFVGLFERNFLAPVDAEGFTAEGVRQLTDTLDRLRELSTRVVAAAMRQAFADAASEKLAELAAAVPLPDAEAEG